MCTAKSKDSDAEEEEKGPDLWFSDLETKNSSTQEVPGCGKQDDET